MMPGVQNGNHGPAYFQRRFVPRCNVKRGLIDVASFIDLTLLLFLVFLVHSSYVLQPGIRLQLPESSFLDGEGFDSLVLTVSQQGMLFFQDEMMRKDTLKERLDRAVFERKKGDEKNVSLLLQADRGVSHEQLVELYNIAMESGIKDVVLATRLPSGPGGPR